MPTRKSKSRKTKSKSKSKSESKSRVVKILNKAKRRYTTHEYNKIVHPEKRELYTIEENNEINRSPTYNINKDLDNKFIEKFIENYPRLKIALEMSGKHSINKTKVTEFIEGQLTPIRRKTAQDLIDNTHYISLKDTFKIIETLLLSTYSKIDLDKTIYLHCGKNNKSFYFFACIALYYIKKHKLKMPEFVSELSPEFILESDDCPIIIVDDVSYSGSQLSNILNNLYYYRTVENRLPPSNIYVLLTALNDKSLERLSKVPTSRSRGFGIYGDFVDTPFDIVYLPNRLYNSLVCDIGIERYYYINLFFNAWLSSDTIIAMYLDHKIADSVSTYKNVYVYGPIVPYDYNILYINEQIMTINSLYAFRSFSDEINERLVADFLRENPDFVRNPQHSFSTLLNEIQHFLTKKAIPLDEIDSLYDPNKKLKFVPFINGCKDSTEIKQIINDIEVQQAQYLFFMFDMGVSSISDYDEDIFEQGKKKTKDFIKKINGFRCPKNWYKDGILQLI